MNTISLQDALARRRSVREFGSEAVSIESLKNILWAAQGITDGDANRTAPSAHALHPLRLLVSAGEVQGLARGLYSVDPQGAELVPVLNKDIRPALRDAAVDDQSWITSASAVITICADMVSVSRDFANQEPYGARGPRYAFIEAGAAAQCAMLQVVAEDLGAVLVAGFRDEATADALELAEPLAPVLHIAVGRPQRNS